MAKDIRLISGRIQTKTTQYLDSNRSRFLSLDNAEPNLGAPGVDNQVLGSLTSVSGSVRNWVKTQGNGITIAIDGGTGQPGLKVDETTIPINTSPLQQSGFFPGIDTTLDVILDNIDSALNEINSTATAGLNVFTDSNFDGNGQSTDPISLDSNLRIYQIAAANRIVADSIGAPTTILRGDGSNITNFPTNVNAVDSIARNALTGGVGISYNASSGEIAIDSNDANVVLQALEIDQDLTVHGNLNVEGTQTIINTSNLNVNDPMIQIAVGNETSDLVDIGWVGHYYTGSLGKVHTGLVRDQNDVDKAYLLFHEYIESSFDTGTPTSTIDTTHNLANGQSFQLATLRLSTIDAYKGDFDSAIINSGDLTITTGNINATNGQLNISSIDASFIDADSADIGLLSIGTIDSAIGINADSASFGILTFDSIAGSTVPLSALPPEIVAGSVDSIDSGRIPDKYLRNDRSDSTSGTLTALGGFRGNIDSADSGNIVTLSGTTATYNSFVGALSGTADSAIALSTTRTFEVTGDVSTSGGAQNFNGTQDVTLQVSLGSGVVDTTELALNAVDSNRIENGAVTREKIAPGAVDSDIDLRVTKAFIDSLNVDADTLDSLNSTQFVRSDINDTIFGDLTFVNNAKARFGNTGDLRIYHDGSNAFIEDVGTGNINVLTHGHKVLIRDSATGNVSAVFSPDSGVFLNYNNSEKLRTTNTGVTVTGTLLADSGALNGFRIITTKDFAPGGGINADTLDSLNSTQFLRSDQDDSMAGTLFIDNTLSANNITRRNSPVVAGTYGSQIAIPIITVDSSGFLDSVGTVAVDGVDSIQFNDTTGVLTVFTGSGTSLTDSITLDPFTTTDLAEGDNLYYTDARADSAARSAVSVTNSIHPGLNTTFYPYGLSYDSSTGVFAYNGIDSEVIRNAVGISGGGSGSGQTGSENRLDVERLRADSAYIATNLYIGYGVDGTTANDSSYVKIYRLNYVDSAFIKTLSFDSVDSDTKANLLAGLISEDVNGQIDSSYIPDKFLRNDKNDSTSGQITADGGFVGPTASFTDSASIAHAEIDSAVIVLADIATADIDVLTGDSATFNRLNGSLDGSYLDNTSVANGKLVNSTITLSDGTNNQTVALGDTFTIADGTDINVVVGNTRTATVNNTSTLATVTGRGDSTSNGITVGNFKTTGYIRGPSVLTIDPEDYDSISGTVRILGDLQVEGTTTTINSTEVSINDKTLTLADSVATAALADGAGIIIDGANATWLYKDVSVTGSDSAWVSNINISAPRISAALNADNLDTGEIAETLLPDYLQTGGTGEISAASIEDVFLRNDGDDSTTGKITADGGFVGDIFAGNGTSKILENGTNGTNAIFTGSVTGNATSADSATTAARWTNTRTVTFAGGDVTGTFNIRGDSNVSNINLTIANDAVVLGDQTDGNYVEQITAGFGINVTNGQGEGVNSTIAVDSASITGLLVGGTGVTIVADSISIGQDVATTADVTFGSVIADSVISIGETTSRDYLTIGGATTNETFGITFVDPTTATSGAHVSYKDSTNTLTLGTVSSSNKTEAITIEPSAIGIFNTNPDKALDVSGEIRASSVITSSVTGSGGFSGDGRSLTNIDATEVTNFTGPVHTSAIDGVYGNITGVGILTTGAIDSQFGSINVGTDNITAGYFYGDGSNLTNIPAGQLTGSIATGAISGNYPGITGVGTLDSGAIDSTFGGINIGTSVFTGDGSGLFNINATTLDGIDLEEISRTVVITDSDNGSGSSANYYYKIAEYSFTTANGDGTFLYAIMPEDAVTHAGATILSVHIKYGSSSLHVANADILAMGGTIPFDDDAFKLTRNASTSELWMQVNTSSVRLKVIEIGSFFDNLNLTYYNYGAWTNSTPSSTASIISSNGLRYQNFQVFHQGTALDSAEINNPTITGDLTLGDEVQFDDNNANSSGNTRFKHNSVVRSSTSPHVFDTSPATTTMSGKYLITAQRGFDNHITELNFITTLTTGGSATSVSAAEFGTVYTLNELFTVEMDVSGGNVRLVVTPTTSSTTTFKFQATIFHDG